MKDVELYRHQAVPTEEEECVLPRDGEQTRSSLCNDENHEGSFEIQTLSQRWWFNVSRQRLYGIGILVILVLLLSLLAALATLWRDAMVHECLWPVVIEYYTTCPSRGIFLQEMPVPRIVQCSTNKPKNNNQDDDDDLSAVDKDNPFLRLEIWSNETFQTMEGLGGYTLTGGSAQHLSHMDPDARTRLLRELFGNNRQAGELHISYLRLSIGASDLEEAPFSYIDHVEPGQQEEANNVTNLDNFSMKVDETFLIPIIQEILAINPNVKFLATPWSAPPAFKDNKSFRGGTLLPEFYDIYARYFVLYLQQMERYGIHIDAITVQNEPLWGGNNPSMVLTAVDEATFIRDHFAPALIFAGLNTKIILYDHNADRWDYPVEILSDPFVKSLVHGTAFHLYAGEVESLSKVHDAHPDKSIYFTEQWVSSEGDLEGDLLWHLSSNSQLRPYTDGGCGLCLGAVTIDGNDVTRNAAYYLFAHGSPFVPPGAVRVNTTDLSHHGVHNVGFLVPETRRLVLLFANVWGDNTTVLIDHEGAQIQFDLLGRSLSTLSLKYSRW